MRDVRLAPNCERVGSPIRDLGNRFGSCPRAEAAESGWIWRPGLRAPAFHRESVMLPPILVRCLRVLWASPWSLFGCGLGVLALATGGGVQIRRGIMEFHGGILPRLLGKAPIAGGASALTLGHTVLACSVSDLDRCRDHEIIHVRQYERWGPFFVPAYFIASGWAWWNGLDAYLDNPFECEAYDASNPSFRAPEE